jgi:hypothetical protein
LHANRKAAVWLAESPAIAAGTQLSGRRKSRRLEHSPPAPAASVVTAATTNQPEQQQKHDGPDKGVDDERDNAYSEVNAKLRQQPIADKGTDQADQQIANQSEPTALHDPACQVSGDNSNEDDNEKALVG